ISVGNAHSCAVLEGGTIKCWGYDQCGELGDGTTTYLNGYRDPVDVKGISGASNVSVSKTWFSGNGTPRQYAHTCAALAVGGVRCWGASPRGALGLPSESLSDWCLKYRRSSIPISVPWTNGGALTVAGQDHSCVLQADGRVQCWGGNQYGQLGDGSNRNSSAPVAVAGLEKAVGLTAGRFHNCAVTETGKIWCWGSNAAGQLGNSAAPAEHCGFWSGRQSCSTTPLAVTGLSNAELLSAGGYHTCALSNGRALCWGSNEWGQLGDGSQRNSETPVAVVGLEDVIGVSAGVYHTCVAPGRDGPLLGVQ
ncbi:MAG: hypothetical protein HZA90_00005, partial [Verrucomicrobia bacterium]|nr:hypothetical protein [Verrucomicrobiota bacterium]